MSRNDRDVTGSFPEIAARAAALGIGPVILDGEIVALDQNGAPSFSLLANRVHVRSPTTWTAASLAGRGVVWTPIGLPGED